MFAFPLKDDDLGLPGLAGLFDLLARFDYEDKRKAQSGVNKDSLVSAPKESLLDPDE